MRNKIEFSETPAEMFANPWQDPGVSPLAELEPIWQKVAPARISGFAVSAYAQIERKIADFATHSMRHKRFDQAVIFNAVPFLVNQLKLKKNHVFIGDLALLKGASGTRLINQYRWGGEIQREDRVRALDEFFADCRADNAGFEPTVVAAPPDVPIVIECRNTFNFFHFITESLAQLTLFDGMTEGREVIFHFPHSPDKQRGFAPAFVEALFPELAGRVRFERTPAQYDRAIIGFDLLGAAPQIPLDEDLVALMSPAHRSGATLGSLDFQPLLAMNSVSAALMRLRRRALAMIEGKPFDHLPRRFYVGRREDHARTRPVAGEDRLLDHLGLFDFKAVAFEDFAPLEQIALMARAEMVILPHGAGLTHMLFASPQTHVIELGTLQTAQFRWADFWPLAHAAQCRYVNFFADFNAEDPTQEPHFGTDGMVPIALSDTAVAQILSYVVCVLGHIPEIPSQSSLEVLAQRLLEIDMPEIAQRVLEAHERLVTDSATLCLLLADSHKALDAPKSELVALDRAFKADPSRWRTLIRIIWCANRVERPQVIRWALSRLERDFPERHSAFVGNHTWVRYVA